MAESLLERMVYGRDDSVRKVWWVLLLVVVALVVSLVLGGALDDDGGGGKVAGVSGAASTGGGAEGAAGRVDTADAAETPSPFTPTTEVAAADSLPPADRTAPPVAGFGVYQGGKILLAGSVPDAAMAEGYRRRFASVIGEDNVSVAMTLDPRVTAQTLTVDVQEHFTFPENSVVYDPEFDALLSLGAFVLKLIPESTLVVTGHTDDRGDAGTNLALSVARAQLIADFMVRGGIPADRIDARGAGETQPIADNATPEGRQANRRIEAMLEGVRPG